MRTTLTIDDHTYALLKEKAMQMDKPFKQVVTAYRLAERFNFHLFIF